MRSPEAAAGSGLLTVFVQRFATSPFAELAGLPPWRLTLQAEKLVAAASARLGEGYRIAEGIALHASAHVEAGAIVKAPAIIGPSCFIAATAYLRGGVFLEADCVIGPAAELKSSFLFRAAKLAHLNFVGDSILGAGVNCEAGAIVANHRNELADKRIAIAFEGGVIATGVEKFGALIGDGARLGAHAVLAPGALIRPRAVIGRLALVDQRPTGDVM